MTKTIVLNSQLKDFPVEKLGASEWADVIYTDDFSTVDLEMRSSVKILIVTPMNKITESTINMFPSLKLIYVLGGSVDNVDMFAAEENSITLKSAKETNSISTAELTMHHMLSLAKEYERASDVIESGKWDRTEAIGSELFLKTLGIVGFGNVGKKVARMAKAFSMNVIVYDPYVENSDFILEGVESKSFEELLFLSDYVSIHVPLNEETKGMFNKKTFSLMKSGSYLINTARGAIVDEDALLEAKESGKIKLFALDVFSEEPLPLDSKIMKSSKGNVLTPHWAGHTVESRKRLYIKAIKDINKLNVV